MCSFWEKLVTKQDFPLESVVQKEEDIPMKRRRKGDCVYYHSRKLNCFYLLRSWERGCFYFLHFPCSPILYMHIHAFNHYTIVIIINNITNRPSIFIREKVHEIPDFFWVVFVVVEKIFCYMYTYTKHIQFLLQLVLFSVFLSFYNI